MAALGYAHASKSLDGIDGEFDAVITRGCGDSCPPGACKRREDWGLPDPRDMDDDGYRAVRDEIGARVRALLESLQEAPRWPEARPPRMSGRPRAARRVHRHRAAAGDRGRFRGHGRGAGRRHRRCDWGTDCSPTRARYCRRQGTLRWNPALTTGSAAACCRPSPVISRSCRWHPSMTVRSLGADGR